MCPDGPFIFPIDEIKKTSPDQSAGQMLLLQNIKNADRPGSEKCLCRTQPSVTLVVFMGLGDRCSVTLLNAV